MLVISSLGNYAQTPHNARKTNTAQQTVWKQVCRQRWWALPLIIWAKLEAVNSSINN